MAKTSSLQKERRAALVFLARLWSPMLAYRRTFGKFQQYGGDDRAPTTLAIGGKGEFRVFFW
jgi:hypothetical protein